MTGYVIIAIILAFWSTIYLLDSFLKSNDATLECYLTLLANSGFSVGFGQFRWFTTRFNRLFLRMGRCRPRLIKLWFTIGVIFGILLMFLAILLLTMLVYNTLTKKQSSEQVLTPVVPGVNLPSDQIWYYLLTLLVCGVFHEMGHAIAAVMEGVKINGFGIFVFAIYPGAYVDLMTEHLHAISPFQQLRIFCAGVWHNFVIVLIALLTLVSIPWLLSPFYMYNNGVLVTSVKPSSAVAGTKGIWVGDTISYINNCPVSNVSDWVHCINTHMNESNQGFCLPLSVVKQQDISLGTYRAITGHTDCCSNNSLTHICFSYYLKGSEKILNYVCLPARTTTEHPSCLTPSDCVNPGNPSVCVVPSLDNSTKLLKVGIKGRRSMLFLGHPLDLHYSIILSNSIPRSMYIPLNLPYVLELFCQYLISLSGALALLNVVPCYALDGQWILLSLTEIFLRPLIPNGELRGVVYSLLLLAGTILIVSNVVLALYVVILKG